MENQASLHYAVIDPYERRIRLSRQGQTIVENEKARILKEVGKSVYHPVYYFPK